MKNKINSIELKPLVKMGCFESAVIYSLSESHKRVGIKIKLTINDELYFLVGVRNGNAISFSGTRALVKYLKSLGISKIELGGADE